MMPLMMPHFVELFAFSHDLERVILVRKAKDCKFKRIRGKLCGVGGKVEEGENARDAAEREFLEETGVRVNCHWINICRRWSEDGLLQCFATILPQNADPQTMENKGEYIIQISMEELLVKYAKLKLAPGMLFDLVKAYAEVKIVDWENRIP